MRNTRSFLLIVNVLSAVVLSAQSTPIAGIINRYATVSASDSCAGSLTVSDTNGFGPGTVVLLFQMQGATISTGNNGQFGTVTALGQAGWYERNEITDVAANTVFLKNRLVRAWQFTPTTPVQLVSVPQFTNATVTDTLRPLPWNGSVGGVLALDVAETLTLDAPISADAAGFRGGQSYVAANNNCTWLLGEDDYVYTGGTWRGAPKGEGVALGQSGQEMGRGPRANGGGGGNDHNSGGGGGAHRANGGEGGDNDEPDVFRCDGYFPGLGGKGLTPPDERLLLGGGGGAGHANNSTSSDGGAGGGIVLISAGSVTGLNPKISANGAAGDTANGDGGGGGGAGGSIWLSLGAAAPNLIVRANGGNGGSTVNNNDNRCFGPGGGGAGGYLRATAPLATLLAQGGVAGTVAGSTNGCNGSTNGAQAGQDGSVLSLTPLLAGTVPVAPPDLSQPLADTTVCTGESVVFSVPAAAGAAGLEWQVDNGNGWLPVAPAATSATLVLNNVTALQSGNQYRLVARREGCYELSSSPALLSVVATPVAEFTWSNLGANTFIFNNLSGETTGQIWDFGDNSAPTTLPAPTHTYTQEGEFTVTLTAWNACDTVSTSQVIGVQLPPVAAFLVPDTVTSCGTAQVTFLNSSTPNATTLTWLFPGGTPETSTAQTPSVEYTAVGTYTATLVAANAAGSDTVSQTFVVNLLPFPVALFTWNSVIDGPDVEFVNLSTGGATYLWDFGDGATSTEFSPTHTYPAEGAYDVTLQVQSPCGVSVLQQTLDVTVGTFEQNASYGALRVYPNPGSGWCTLDGSNLAELPQQVTVWNALGHAVQHVQLVENKSFVNLDLRTLPAGPYVLQVWFENGSTARVWVKQ